MALETNTIGLNECIALLNDLPNKVTDQCTVTSDIALHFSVTEDGILEVTYDDGEEGE